MIEAMSRLQMIGLTAPLFWCERISAIIVQVKIFVYLLGSDILSTLKHEYKIHIFEIEVQNVLFYTFKSFSVLWGHSSILYNSVDDVPHILKLCSVVHEKHGSRDVIYRRSLGHIANGHQGLSGKFVAALLTGGEVKNKLP